tara:strand:+ start:13426 stop:15069 length:1644 start_codon:yes stop_codon:yes gene_type:complete
MSSKRARVAKRQARQAATTHGVRPMKAVSTNVNGAPVSAYEAGDPISQELGSWFPGMASADADWLGERNHVTARIHDLVRNNGWASGAVRREVDAVIGASLRLSYKPDYRALGLDAEWAEEFAETIEGRWRLFANDPDKWADATRHDSIPGLFGLAYRHSEIDGEACAALLWLEKRGQWRTTVQLIDPDRLSNPNDQFDSDVLRGGVQLDQYGAAVGYHVRKRHPFDRGLTTSADAYTWEYIPRETSWGRPLFVHFFEKERAGQSRGISRFVAAVEGLFMDHKHGRIELQAAVLNAILAAVIESPMDGELAAQALAPGGDIGTYQEQRSEFHKERRISVGGVQISTLFPGEKLNMPPASRPNAAFADFQSAVLRKVASAVGQSYEQFSQDWSKVNYSSARAALLEVWRGFAARREVFTQNFCTPIFGAWLEEELASGDYELPDGVPGFWEAKAAWTRCKWIGPARGWVDPVKEIDAAGKRMNFALSTQESEGAEQGGDWRETIDQLAKERRYRAKQGVPDPQFAPAGQQPSPDNSDDETTPSKKEDA